MPSTRALVLGLLVGCAVFVLFAFTLVGLVGEAVAAAAGVGLALRGLCVAVAWARGTRSC